MPFVEKFTSANVARFLYLQDFALLAANIFYPAEANEYFYGEKSVDSGLSSRRALTLLASASLWVAVAQVELEAARRKCVQYGMLMFVAQLAVLVYFQHFSGSAVVTDEAFNLQALVGAFNLLLSVFSVYYVERDEDGFYYFGEPAAAHTTALRLEYVYLLFVGITYMLTPYLWGETLGLGSTVGSEYWMATIGASVAGCSTVCMAFAQIDAEYQQKALQYGMMRHLAGLFYFVGLAGPGVLAADRVNGLNWCYGLFAFEFAAVMYLIYTCYPDTTRKMILRTLYMSAYVSAFFMYWWPSFTVVFMQFTDSSKAAVMPEFAVMTLTVALLLTAASQLDDDAQKKVLQYYLGAALTALVGVSNGYDFGIAAYVQFAAILVITVDLYAEFGKSNFADFADFFPKLPSLSKMKMRSSTSSMSKKSTSKRGRSRTPARK